MLIGDRIKMWREQAGMTYSFIEVHRCKFQLSAEDMEKIEIGEIIPTDRQIYNLSILLEVPLSYFFCEADYNRPAPNYNSIHYPVTEEAQKRAMEQYGLKIENKKRARKK